MANFKPLSGNDLVYRALGYTGWLYADGTIALEAFMPSVKDITGVSIAFTQEDADDQMKRPIHGMAEVHVGITRRIMHKGYNLDIEQDSDIHGEIKNIPYFHAHADGTDEKEKLEDIAQVLCSKICRTAAKSVAYTPKEKAAA